MFNVLWHIFDWLPSGLTVVCRAVVFIFLFICVCQLIKLIADIIKFIVDLVGGAIGKLVSMFV